MALTKVGKEGITGISNSSDATAITIDSSENVGIGTSSPGTFRTKIKQSGTGTTQGMGVEASANDSVLRMFHTGSAAGFNATYSSSGAYVPLTFDVGGAERMRINTNGKIEADKASNPALSGVTNRNTILQLQNTDTGYVAETPLQLILAHHLQVQRRQSLSKTTTLAVDMAAILFLRHHLRLATH